MSHAQQNHDIEPLLPEESSMNTEPSGRSSAESFPRSSTASTTSLVLEHLNGNGIVQKPLSPYRDNVDDFDPLERKFEQLDVEDATLNPSRPADQRYRRWLLVLGTVCAAGWLVALGLFIYNGYYLHRSNFEHDPDATAVFGNGKKITIGQLQRGAWRPASHHIEWISGPGGQDGLLLEESPGDGKDYLIVEDIRGLIGETSQKNTTSLMRKGGFDVGSETITPLRVWVSPNFKTVLVMSDRKHNWRHSYTGRYWLFDVEKQQGKPLDPDQPDGRIQLATWSPNSDAVVFTRDNEMYMRKLESEDVIRITTNGGPEMFNGVPDWVYEEEVFSGNSATWWSGDGKYVAFLATNETRVLEYPVQYFISRPSGIEPPPELENYPETRKIKYPKAGTPNPVVHLRFYDIDKDEVFDVPIEDDFPDNTRLITEVLWAGKSGKVLIRETNRESNVLKMVLIDVERREGRIVRTKDVDKLDGGWFEITETTTFIPADPNNGRPSDGYIDTVIHEGYDHLGYFRSMEDAEPLMLTSGKWEVENAPSAIDLNKNLVYFVSTKEGSIQRHVYSVGLDGTGLEALTDTSKEGYYGVSFSKGAGFALLNYAGPKIPWQKVISTPSNSEEFEYMMEDNKKLGQMAASHELPLKRYSTVTIDGVELNVVERLPPHFREHKRYPVLFFLYGGPGSQQVDKKFAVDFQSYVAATLGYLVVTVDGRGTGFLGRSVRCVIRGNLGYYEARDQIETAKIWAKRTYVDADRMAIWGWSYGGYMTLKTLEQDAGETFSYGMAVAPVTDWDFYDTIYTERWMGTPQHNPEGYRNASVSNVTAIAQNTRFLVMHGVSDDNVHFQNTLTLLDKLDLAGVENYDVHVFPDSDHSIYFHNANKIVYDKLSWWLTNAFNGEWHRIKNPVPLRAGAQVGQTVRRQVEELQRPRYPR